MSGTDTIKPHPLVSAIVRVYNRTDYIRDAIQCLMNQAYKNVEIIIIDDGSPMDIQQHLHDILASPGVRFIRQTHAGEAAALNTGLKNAAGEFIVLLDDDDMLHSEMISKTMAEMNRDKELDIVHTGFALIKGERKICDSDYQPFETFYYSFDNFEDILSTKKCAPINSMLIKKSLFDKIGLADESLEVCDDLDLWLRAMAKRIKVANIRACLSCYRIHTSNITRNSLKINQHRVRILEKSINDLPDDLRRSLHFNRHLSYRTLVTGWQEVLYESKSAGRRKILRSLTWDKRLFMVSMIALLFSFLPRYVILRLTKIMEIALSGIHRFRS